MPQVHLIPVGQFGREVAVQVAQSFDAHISPEQDAGIPSSWPQAAIQVIVSWREVPWLFSLADKMAHSLDRPWMPVTLDSKSLRVGPLIAPHHSGCYPCFIKRQRQHSRLSPTDLELFNHYDANPESGIFGHLPSHVRIASSLISSSVQALLGQSQEGQVPDSSALRVGELTRVGLTGLNVSRGRLIGVHGCPTCSPDNPDNTWKSISQLNLSAEKSA